MRARVNITSIQYGVQGASFEGDVVPLQARVHGHAGPKCALIYRHVCGRRCSQDPRLHLSLYRLGKATFSSRSHIISSSAPHRSSFHQIDKGLFTLVSENSHKTCSAWTKIQDAVSRAHVQTHPPLSNLDILFAGMDVIAEEGGGRAEGVIL